MITLLGLLVTAGALTAVASGLTWLGSRLRRRSVASDVMGPFEEIWHPAAHRARLELQVYEERVIPAPSPDDH